MSRRKVILGSAVFFGLVVLAVSVLLIGRVMAGDPAQETTAPVYWWWDTENPVGTATLVRNSSGITADFETSGLPAGQAMTLWLIFFNNPEHCATSPCTLPADLFELGVDGDFHFLSGHVIDADGEATFGGHLKIGDLSGSGRAEIGVDDGVALMDPFKAEVLLAVHSHGPALSGRALEEQISTFSGGCVTFLGPDGFAAGPEDVPDEEGECSTMQFSLHQGNGE